MEWSLSPQFAQPHLRGVRAADRVTVRQQLDQERLAGKAGLAFTAHGSDWCVRAGIAHLFGHDTTATVNFTVRF